jgi:hypothetical protein
VRLDEDGDDGDGEQNGDQPLGVAGKIEVIHGNSPPF